MDTAWESICCEEIDKIQSLLVGDPSPTYITTYPEFPNTCLNRALHGMDTDTIMTTEAGMCLYYRYSNLPIFVVVSQILADW